MGNLRQKYTDEEWDELARNPIRVTRKRFPLKKVLDQLFLEIEHGDQEHRDWLRNKIDDFYNKNKSKYD